MQAVVPFFFPVHSLLGYKRDLPAALPNDKDIAFDTVSQDDESTL